jgi:hypothetical protein
VALNKEDSLVREAIASRETIIMADPTMVISTPATTLRILASWLVNSATFVRICRTRQSS